MRHTDKVPNIRGADMQFGEEVARCAEERTGNGIRIHEWGRH